MFIFFILGMTAVLFLIFRWHLPLLLYLSFATKKSLRARIFTADVLCGKTRLPQGSCCGNRCFFAASCDVVVDQGFQTQKYKLVFAVLELESRLRSRVCVSVNASRMTTLSRAHCCQLLLLVLRYGKLSLVYAGTNYCCYTFTSLRSWVEWNVI